MAEGKTKIVELSGDSAIPISELHCHTIPGYGCDEIRRHGLNVEKRTRLIKAGSHVIIPDFSQHKKLIKFLFQD